MVSDIIPQIDGRGALPNVSQRASSKVSLYIVKHSVAVLYQVAPAVG